VFLWAKHYLNELLTFVISVKPERTRLSVNIDIAKAVPFGSFVEFNCTTFSNPDADGYKFYRDQEPLGSNTSGVYHLQLQRSGLYSCVPFNSVANGNRAVLRINVNGKSILKAPNVFHPRFENYTTASINAPTSLPTRRKSLLCDVDAYMSRAC